MVSSNDPIESFFNSIQVVKEVLTPLELGIRKAAKDLEHCWAVPKKRGRSNELLTQLNSGDKNSKVQICSVKKKKNGQCVVGDERKGLLINDQLNTLLGKCSQNSGNGDRADVTNGGLKERDSVKEDVSCINCLQFAVTWSLLINSVAQAFPSPFKTVKKQFLKSDKEDESTLCKKQKLSCELKQRESKDQIGKPLKEVGMTVKHKEKEHASFECFIGFVFNQLTRNLQNFDSGMEENDCKSRSDDASLPPDSSSQFYHFKVFRGLWQGRKEDIDELFGNLRFARVGGVPSNVVGVTSSVNKEGDDRVAALSGEESDSTSQQKRANGILGIPLSNVEEWRSAFSTVSLTQLGRPSNDCPDKKKLFSVQDFFRYTESEGRRFFEELDRDGDGQVTLEDLESAMRTRKLPQRYAQEFMSRARSHIFSKSFGWKQFLSFMEQKEPTILRAYTSLCLSNSGTLQKSEIVASLKNAGLPADEENAVAMMRYLNADTEESISYGHFRNFMLLLPSDRLRDDPRNIWFDAATVVAVEPPVEITAGSFLRSALAGGFSCALSCFIMYPIETIKTRVQASTSTFPEVISTLPQTGIQGLYRGAIPAILGQFPSHGLRTGIFEASKLMLINVAPTLPDIQVQSVASFCSTLLGTAVRIPCEVLKQRLQAGLFDNVGEAISGTWHQDGLKGFFRGTGATLCREVPFYVAGLVLYAESKKIFQKVLGRDLEPWETIAVGAVSGGLAAVVTTPLDVVKTRMMTAPQGQSLSMAFVALSILRLEGPLGLYKGAVPRFLWVAPLGALNFAGYELARKALDKKED